MKTQVFIVHGGHAGDSYENYLKYLQEKVVDLDYLRKKAKSWKRILNDGLGDGYEVFNPQMPNTENAHYAEWKIWFEKFVPYFTDGIILVGHSLGGMFLAKYLSENELPVQVRATFLVAPPFEAPSEHPQADFKFLAPFTKLAEQSPDIFLYHSKDDEIVPFSNLERYQHELPQAHARISETKGHFNQETFPELITDILNLDK